MAEGYVKLHRQLIDWEWFADSATVHVMTYLMITANWKEAKWMGVTIPPGATVTSREKIAAHTGLSEKQVRLALDKLEKGRVIERDRAGKGQLVTLVNWAKYQGDDDEQGRQRASNRAGRGPTKGQQLGRQRAGIEEGKEGEEGKNGRISVAERQSAFRTRCAEIYKAGPILEPAEAKRFFDYWTETNPKGTRMRFEMERTFDVKLRMTNWASRVRPANGKTNGRPTATEQLLAEVSAGLFDDNQAAVSGPAGSEAHSGAEASSNADVRNGLHG